MYGTQRFYFPEIDTQFSGMFAHGAGALVIEEGSRKKINGLDCRKSILGFSDKTKWDVTITCNTFGVDKPILVKCWRAEEETELFYLVP
jgi:hypothetical protein